jgi:magnesium transporter
MSDDGEHNNQSGFSTPVPELDDHRRPRRGTFDSLYGSQRREGAAQDALRPQVRDFEEAIVDDDVAVGSIAAPATGTYRSRRPTVESTPEPRAVSPPNSVKAFAEARRQRDLSFDDTKGDKKPDEQDMRRTASVISRVSHRSRPQTALTTDDAASLASNKSAEEDVCFPVQDDHAEDSLYIDFDCLENFIKEDAEARAAQRRTPVVHVFHDLRSGSQTSGTPTTRMVTVNGDLIDVPCDVAIEKEQAGGQAEAQDETEVQVSVPADNARAAQVDPNRVSFFSSAWESTIHAAELGDLVLPGEELRGLFEFPKDETDGVWWLNINNPSEDEARAVCRSFGVHPLTIEDITTQESREKIELFSKYYFACFRSFRIVHDEFDQEEFEPLYIYVIVFREGTLSFSYESNSHASHVRRRISMLKDYVALSSDWICYALM